MKKKRGTKIVFIYHADYLTGIDTNYSITFGFLNKYYKDNYVVIKHSLYTGGETRVYHKGEHGGYKSFHPLGKIPAPLRYVFETLFSIFQLVVLKPSVVISLNPLSSLAPCILKSVGIIKEVFFINPDFARRRFNNAILNSAYYWVDRYCTKHCTLNICNSKYVIEYKKNIYKNLDLTSKFLHIPNVPNYWQMDKYQKYKKIKNRIIYVGNMAGQINFQKIVDIVDNLANIEKSVHLVFVGGGKDEQELKNYVKSRNIYNVEFLGVLPHSDTLKEIAKSEFGIALYTGSLSYDEFRDSCKIREYQSLGCVPITTPVVKSNTGEIEKYHSGIVISNLDDLYDSVASLLIDRVRMDRLVAGCKKTHLMYKYVYEKLYKLVEGSAHS